MGLNKAIHFCDFGCSVRDVVNITAVAGIDGESRQEDEVSVGIGAAEQDVDGVLHGTAVKTGLILSAESGLAENDDAGQQRHREDDGSENESDLPAADLVFLHRGPEFQRFLVAGLSHTADSSSHRLAMYVIYHTKLKSN